MGLPVRFSRLFVDGEPADEVLLTAGKPRAARGASIFPETSLPLDLPGNEEAGSRWAP